MIEKNKRKKVEQPKYTNSIKVNRFTGFKRGS